MDSVRGRIKRPEGDARFDERGRVLVKSLGKLDPTHAQTYFIRCGEFVKIGYGQDPVERMYELQPHNPFPMTLLAVLPGGMNTERKWHRDYAAYRHAHEWFRYDGELRAAIDALPPYEDPRRAWQRQQMAAELA